MEIWRGRVLWRGYVHPHTQLKKSGFSIPIPSQCGDSPSKRERVRAIPTGTGLFAISNSRAPAPTSATPTTSSPARSKQGLHRSPSRPQGSARRRSPQVAVSSSSRRRRPRRSHSSPNLDPLLPQQRKNALDPATRCHRATVTRLHSRSELQIADGLASDFFVSIGYM